MTNPTAARASSPTTLDPSMVRWGERSVSGPLRSIARGRVRAEVLDGGLDRLRSDDVMIARRVYAAVRDEQWATVPAHVRDLSVTEGRETTDIRMQVEHAWPAEDPLFLWEANITVGPDLVQIRFDGQALREFRRTRIGLCVLHPLHLGGVEVEAQAVASANSADVSGVRRSCFPMDVQPWQIFRDLGSLSYTDRGVRVRFAFEGDRFETEDQRNWSDASYKTYSTPLDASRPRIIRRGDRVSQQVSVWMTPPAQQGGTAFASQRSEGPARLQVGEIVGQMPSVGLQRATERPEQSETDMLEQARPAFLHVAVDLGDPGWSAAMSHHLACARACGAPLTVNLTTAPGGISTGDLRDALDRFIARAAGVVERVLVFDHAAPGTSREALASVYDHLSRAGIEVGGGSRADFATVNRNDALPVDLLDAIAFPIAAEVHDTDLPCLRESLSTHRILVDQARHRTTNADHPCGMPVFVGPVSFAPTYPTWSVGPARSDRDRHPSVFGAAWMLAAVAELAGAAAHAVSLCATLGTRGVLPGDGSDHPRPIMIVLRWLAASHAADRRKLDLPVDDVHGVAFDSEGTTTVLLANVGGVPRTFDVSGSTGPWRVLAADPREAAGWSVISVPAERGRLSLPAPSVAARQEGPHDGTK